MAQHAGQDHAAQGLPARGGHALGQLQPTRIQLLHASRGVQHDGPDRREGQQEIDGVVAHAEHHHHNRHPGKRRDHAQELHGRRHRGLQPPPTANRQPERYTDQ
ncbi:hypothetical protein G6F65_020300 [Rhizopus arrhizus]|nr:hypothetical protein G6F65_020300 [Rhizopus arrhizus]